jgi:hypothetical protein
LYFDRFGVENEELVVAEFRRSFLPAYHVLTGCGKSPFREGFGVRAIRAGIESSALSSGAQTRVSVLRDFFRSLLSSAFVQRFPERRIGGATVMIASELPTIYELAAFVTARAFSGPKHKLAFADPNKNHAHMPVVVVALPG